MLVPAGNKTNSVWFYLKGKDHRRARIAGMTKEEKEKRVSTLEKWLEMKIKRE